MPAEPDGDLDRALDLFHRSAHEYAGGMSNHGPMVVESLDHSGRVESIAMWTAAYAERLDPAGPTRSIVSDPLLGDGRADVWTTHFLDELARREWTDVVTGWLPRLVPGSAGAAGHGVLRAAHAVRSLGRSQSEVRIVELAHGLGYWAATAHALPGLVPSGTATLRHALEAVPATSSEAWFISERVAAIDARAFGPAVGAAALPSDADEALTAVVDLALRVLATNPEGAIAFVHGVTVPCCLRHLLPYADPAGRAAVAMQGWWVLAALWSAYGRRPPLAGPPTIMPSWDELITSAIADGDEHQIKLSVAAHDQAGRVDDTLARAAVASVVGVPAT